MQELSLFVCWTSASAIAWLFVGYPIALWLRGKKEPRSSEVSASIPSVAIVIAAYNEKCAIGEKLNNTRALDYPKELMEIVVVSDASSDGTDDIVKPFAGAALRLIRSETRQGKSACQALAIRATDAEVVVFTDTASMLEPSSLRALVEGFSEPTVGCVSGWDIARSGVGRTQGETLYIRYEMLLRKLEMRGGSLVSASGCLFAARRELCLEWPDGLTSDFAIPLRARQQGFRTICEQSAVCRYDVLDDSRAEFRRKTRTVVHGLQVVRRFLDCLLPWRMGFFSIQLFSHKLLRWLLPAFLVALLVSTAVLSISSSLVKVVFLTQFAFYLLGGLALAFPSLTRYAWVRWPYFFMLVNASMIVAWRSFISGTDERYWEPTRR